MSLPEVHLIGGTGTEAAGLAPVATALRAAGLLTPVLVTAGPDTAAAARALAAFDLLPDVTLPTGTAHPDATIRRLAALWDTRGPAAVLVQGDGQTAVAGALAAAWRRIPVVHLTAGRRADGFAAPSAGEPGSRLIAQVATLHLTPEPIAAMNLLDEGIAAGAILIAGDTGSDAATAGRRVPAPRVPSPYGDGRAAQRAAQATAALLGRAEPPAPMPIPSFPAAPAGVTGA